LFCRPDEAQLSKKCRPAKRKDYKLSASFT
jgi:hypothetical protein